MVNSILFWNQVALDASKTDFSSSDPSIAPTPQNPGPTATSRALAIVHLAMHDAYVGVKESGNSSKTYLNYMPIKPGTTDTQAAQAAVSAAAMLTLSALYNRQRETFLKKHAEFLAMLADVDPKISKGLKWGTLVAERMLAERQNDGSGASNDYAASNQPYRHRPDPLNAGQGFLGPRWGQVNPFGINNLNAAITALPDPVTLPEYAADFAEVAVKGRDQGSTRTDDETTIGLFWAYDGARNIGVPPRLYNQVVLAILEAKGGVNEAQYAKILAMVNVAMADAGIQAWHEKYKHSLWRPVVGIREAEAGWGPTGKGDSLGAATIGEPYWQPLGAPRTNSSGPPAVTPNFPAYPSGHATFGTAAFRVVQLALGLADTFAFTFVSDEFNGENVGATGVRPRYNRNLTIASAIQENVSSRVFLGVHWRLDGRKGEQIGNEIATKIVAAFPARA